MVIGPNTCSRATHKSKCSLPPETHIFIAQEDSLPVGFEYQVFRTEKFLQYDTFYHGSGPVDMLSMVKFIKEFDKIVFQKGSNLPQKIICSAGHNRRSFTCTSFLLGAYMILKLELKSSHTSYCFRGINQDAFEPFKESGSSVSDFSLSLADCWQALERAKSHGWIGLPQPNAPYRWGQIDMDAFAYYNDPLNADMNEIIPGTLYAMRMPKDLAGNSHEDM